MSTLPPKPVLVRDVTTQAQLCRLGRHLWHVCDKPECSERRGAELWCMSCGETKTIRLEWDT